MVATLRRDDVQLDAAGLGFPGLVDFDRGVARSSVMLDGWREVPLARLVQEATGLPCAVDNDVNTAALAEIAVRGGVAGALLFVAVGTGIGGALALNGKLWRGASGVAGEIGNTTIDVGGALCWCGRRGCLNTLASGSAVERRLGAAPGSLDAELRRRGREVEEELARAAAHLGAGLANAMNLVNPSLIVLGGALPLKHPRFVEVAAKVARAQAFAEAAEVCRIEAARAGYEAGAVGAGLLASRAHPASSAISFTARP